MRTTVSIDDELLVSARRRAAQRGLTLSDVVNQALQRDLAAAVPGRGPAIPVFRGGTGPSPGVDLTSNRALLELLDEDVPLDRRR